MPAQILVAETQEQVPSAMQELSDSLDEGTMVAIDLGVLLCSRWQMSCLDCSRMPVAGELSI